MCGGTVELNCAYRGVTQKHFGKGVRRLTAEPTLPSPERQQWMQCGCLQVCSIAKQNTSCSRKRCTTSAASWEMLSVSEGWKTYGRNPILPRDRVRVPKHLVMSGLAHHKELADGPCLSEALDTSMSNQHPLDRDNAHKHT